MIGLLLLLQTVPLVAGQHVEVQEVDGGAWKPGEINGVTRKEDGTIEYRVSRKNGNFTMDGYFPPARVRASAGAAAADGPLYAVDQMVEVQDHGSDAWRPAKVNRIEGSPGYWRYNAVFVGGNRGESEFYKERIRPFRGVAAPSGKTRTGTLVLGTYACTRWLAPGQVQPPVGSITLLPNGSYRWLDDGGTGRFSYDAANGAIRFLTGPIAAKQPRSASYTRDGSTSQIDLNFAYGVDWSCGHNL